MKRKYLICVNHVCPSCSLLLWVTGSLGSPANNTLISDKKWKLKQTCQRFVCGQRRKWQCDFKSRWFQGSGGQNIMLKRDERLEFWAQSCHLKIHHPLTPPSNAWNEPCFRCLLSRRGMLYSSFLSVQLQIFCGICTKCIWRALKTIGVTIPENQAFTVALRGKRGRIALRVLDTKSISTKSESRASQTSCKALLQKDGQFLCWCYSANTSFLLHGDSILASRSRDNSGQLSCLCCCLERSVEEPQDTFHFLRCKSCRCRLGCWRSNGTFVCVDSLSGRIFAWSTPLRRAHPYVLLHLLHRVSLKPCCSDGGSLRSHQLSFAVSCQVHHNSGDCHSRFNLVGVFLAVVHLLRGWLFEVHLCVCQHGCGSYFGHFSLHLRSNFASDACTGFAMGCDSTEFAVRGQWSENQGGVGGKEHHTGIYGDVGLLPLLLYSIVHNNLHDEFLFIL